MKPVNQAGAFRLENTCWGGNIDKKDIEAKI
jgi:hypothetical protein